MSSAMLPLCNPGVATQIIVNHAFRIATLSMNRRPEHEPPVESESLTPEVREVPNPPVSQDTPTPSVSVTQDRPKPSYVLLGIVSTVALALDLGTKWWALHTLEKPLAHGEGIPAPIQINSWLTFVLARNRGGAWGLLQTANEEIRKPFFLVISLVAIGFIVYLFRRVHPKQHALKWGLPLVLGGAIGNLVDRIRYGWVIDFIDYRASWVRWLNERIASLSPTHGITDHWPTFNIADVAICVGVGLMAIDMFTSRAHHHRRDTTKVVSLQPEQGSAVEPNSPAASSNPPPSDPTSSGLAGQSKV